MKIHELLDLIEEPEIQRQALSGYTGAFALGVGGAAKAPVVILDVEDNAEAVSFPPNLRIHGETIPLIVNYGFTAPDAYAF